MSKLYEVVRFYQSDKRRPVVQRRNLDLKQAQDWCNDPETSSATASKYSDKQRERLNEKQLNWFDGYREQ
jgi:ABC-type nitrate/sulfonate/bicarbonate transport system substrate-binding protein